jgi:hypothetical protein
MVELKIEGVKETEDGMICVIVNAPFTLPDGSVINRHEFWFGKNDFSEEKLIEAVNKKIV